MRALSKRQSEVLTHIAEGFEDKEIAKLLAVSPSTIKTYATGVLDSLGARNRTHTVAIAYQSGILKVKDPA